MQKLKEKSVKPKRKRSGKQSETRTDQSRKSLIRRIDGEQRFYEIDGVKYPSVTTILNVINKPALTNWKVSVVIEHLRSIPAHHYTPETVFGILELARTKPAELTKDAQDVGSEVHEWLEVLVKAKIAHPDMKWGDVLTGNISREVFENLDGRVKNCIVAFLEWAITNDFEPTMSEVTVYSKKKRYAGTLDCVGRVNGKLYLIDFKSSKAYYDEMALQLSAYRYALNERHDQKVWGMAVMRLGKLDGTFEFIKVMHYQKHFGAFMSARKLWAWQNTK